MAKNNKILVISDIHLSKNFKQKKYDALENIIKRADKVIINGDFWDSWHCTFDEFIKTKWSGLFPLLLARDTVYLFGNHDPKYRSNNNVSLFSVQTGERFEYISNGTTYRFEHGHKLLDSSDGFFMRIYDGLMHYFERHSVWLFFLMKSWIEKAGFVLFGDKVMCESGMTRKRNNRLKKFYKKDWLICGDTHFAEVDHKNKFANSGCIIHGHLSYLVITNGKIELVNTNTN
ncbi:hypothetical protein HGB25_01440 [Candidatus Saccharibacteria bacterium]|nr:hypothetical protein [Candidatus Saccharibacteria bacterium]